MVFPLPGPPKRRVTCEPSVMHLRMPLNPISSVASDGGTCGRLHGRLRDGLGPRHEVASTDAERRHVDGSGSGQFITPAVVAPVVAPRLDALLSAPPEVYLLALVPAVLWGLSPVFSKRGMSAGGNALQASLVVVVVDGLLYWTVLLALQGLDLFANLTPGALATFVLAGLVGTSLGRIAVFAGVERVGASVNSAAISTRPLFATALAVGFLGEPVTLTTGVGVVVIVAGLLVLASARGGDLSGWDRRELLFPVGAAAFFAVGNVLRRFGLQTTATGPLEAVAINETAALVGLAAFALAGREPGVVRAPGRTYGYFAASGTLTAVALLSLFAAFAHPEGRIAVVDPIAATAPLFTAVFAAALLADVERVTRDVVAGAALIVVGVALVVASTGGGAA